MRDARVLAAWAAFLHCEPRVGKLPAMRALIGYRFGGLKKRNGRGEVRTVDPLLAIPRDERHKNLLTGF